MCSEHMFCSSVETETQSHQLLEDHHHHPLGEINQLQQLPYHLYSQLSL